MKFRVCFSPSEVVPQDDAPQFVFSGSPFCGLFFGKFGSGKSGILYSMRNASKIFLVENHFRAERVR